MQSALKITATAFLFLIAQLFCFPIKCQPLPATSKSTIVEIRTYNLKENARDNFHRLFVERAMPLLKKWNIQVVGYGPSLHDKNTYTLIRAYQTLDQMQKSEEAFYASDEWRQGPRASVLALIESYTTLVIKADRELVTHLQKSLEN